MTHALWDVEFDGDTYFHICSKVRSSSGQEGQFFKLIILFLKYTFLIQFFSQDSKHIICIEVQQLKLPKIMFQKSDAIPLSSFWTIAKPKIEVLA